MNKFFGWRVLIVVALLVMLAACASQQPVPVAEEPPATTVQEPAAEPAPEPLPAPEPEPEAAGPSEYVMTEEMYEETKRDLGELVQELNKIVAAKDYERWLSYLTAGYRAYYSDPEVLRTQSESPLLKKYNIVLRSLKDYFHYVVVGSRQNVRLDEIKALDENRVRAYMYIDNTPVIIYELQKIDDSWKIGIIDQISDNGE